MSETAERIRDFLLERDGCLGSRAELTDDLPLLNDLLDSLAVLDLVLMIESEFLVEVADDDLEPANFATIANIVAFIDERVARID